MSEFSLNLSSQKERQNNILYQKIKTKNKEVAKNLIINYDLTNSILKVIKNNMESLEKMKKAVQDHFDRRETFIQQLCRSL
jgi:hypothetical protein